MNTESTTETNDEKCRSNNLCAINIYVDATKVTGITRIIT